MNRRQRKVVVLDTGPDLNDTVEQALDQCGLLARIQSSTRVVLKPNLTYPFYKRGVTTSLAFIRASVLALRKRTNHIAIVECDGGYGAWKVEAAFEGHGLYKLGRELGVEIASLHEGEREPLIFHARGTRHQLQMPTRLLHDTDVFVTMPVPKIHSMTGLTLAHKNQWGCIPDDMRMRSHHVFNEAIIAINRALQPVVLADGAFFLDVNGPMEGVPVKMNLVIAATDVGTFDRYVSELMGWSWKDVPHLRAAAKSGTLPTSLDEIDFNVSPAHKRRHYFRLERTLRNYLAYTGFRSRTITWFGYESWFGKQVLHRILYAIAGENVKPAPDNDSVD